MTLNFYNSKSPYRCDYIFAVLFLCFSALQLLLIVLTPLDLAADEAYYWDWSRNLDWSYYSKGPLVAWLISVSCYFFGDTALAVRFPAFLCLSIFSLLFYFFIRRKYSPSTALLSWLGLRTMLLFFSQGYVMTTDAPAALFWFLAVASIFHATVEDKTWWWIPGLAAIGVGVLAKYTLLLLYPSVFLFLLVVKPMRSHLKDKKFWFGTLLMVVIMMPILFWNLHHGWVNVQHNGGHLVSSKGFLSGVRFLPELILGQFGIVGPVFFVVFLMALRRAYLGFREGDNESGLYLFTIVPLLVICLLVSLSRRVYPNWPMPMYISGILLTVHLVCSANFLKPSLASLCKWHFGLNSLFVFITCLFVLGVTFPVQGKFLPTKKLVAWEELGASVQKELSSFETESGAKPEIIAGNYDVAAELSFYVKDKPRVYCAPVGKRRMNQYDIWGGWEGLKGKNAIVVLKDPQQSEELKSYFTRLEPIEPQPTYEAIYHGSTINKFYFYRAYDNTGYSPLAPKGR